MLEKSLATVYGVLKSWHNSVTEILLSWKDIRLLDTADD